MTKLVPKLLTGAAVVVVAAVAITALNNNGNNNQEVDFSGGVSTNVECEEINSTRGAVDTELAERNSAAGEALATELEAASDAYWETRRGLEDARTACETEALLADPCKDLFEKSSALADQILQNLDGGFDEAMFQERERVKEEYDQCLKNPPAEDTYPGRMEQCKTAFDTGNTEALEVRAATETAAQTKHDQAVEAAEAAHAQKMAELDALEQHCEDTKYERKYGSIPNTGIPVTNYQGGSPACTGIFPGYDPELAQRISRLESLRSQAQAGGSRAGFLDASELGTEINRLRSEMAAGPAKCERDSDCGGPVPVCCNIKEIGRAFCDGGSCANEKIACGAEEVCAGEPASCLAFVQVIQYEDYLIPTSQLHIGEHAEGCQGDHWHGNATTLSGMPISDPDPNGCGFGTVNERPTFQVYPPSQMKSAIDLGGQTIEVGADGQFIDKGYQGEIRVEGGIFGN